MTRGQEEESEKPWMWLYLSQDQVDEEAKLGGSAEGEIYLDNQPAQTKALRQEETHPVEGDDFWRRGQRPTRQFTITEAILRVWY